MSTDLAQGLDGWLEEERHTARLAEGKGHDF